MTEPAENIEEAIIVPLVEIKIPDLDVQSGTVTVSWSVSPELLKSLADHHNHDPHIVIVTATSDRARYHITKESRRVVSLKDGLAYIEFRSAGENSVWAFVPVADTGKSAKNEFLSRRDGEYSTTVLDNNGEGWAWNVYSNSPYPKAPILRVIVPEGAFAKEPSAFEKAWVNWLYKKKCVDQCAFRRRRMFAYTLQIFPYLGSMFLRILGTFAALMIGARDFSFDLITHPMRSELGNVLDIFENGSIFITKISDRENPFSMYWKGNTRPNRMDAFRYLKHRFRYLPFMPLALVFEAFIVAAIVFTHFILLWMLLSIVGGIGLYFGTLTYRERRAEQNKAKVPEGTPWYLKEEEMDFIIHNPNKGRNLSSLPFRKRTLKLRFLDLKSKVCRPFSV